MCIYINKANSLNLIIWILKLKMNRYRAYRRPKDPSSIHRLYNPDLDFEDQYYSEPVVLSNTSGSGHQILEIDLFDQFIMKKNGPLQEEEYKDENEDNNEDTHHSEMIDTPSEGEEEGMFKKDSMDRDEKLRPELEQETAESMRNYYKQTGKSSPAAYIKWVPLESRQINYH